MCVESLERVFKEIHNDIIRRSEKSILKNKTVLRREDLIGKWLKQAVFELTQLN